MTTLAGYRDFSCLSCQKVEFDRPGERSPE